MLRIRKTGLAIAVGAALTSYASTAAINTDVVRSYQSDVQHTQGQATYVIQLNAAGGFSENKAQRMKNVANIQTQQANIIAQLKQLDPELVVNGQVRLVGNSLNISMNKAAAESLKQHALIASVTQVAKFTPHTPKLSSSVSEGSQHYVTVAQNALKPSSETSEGDDNAIRVAVIGTGVDYTHTALGGDGQLESYIAAWSNAANDYSGFPTDTVVDGRDFSSEAGWGLDANPIDSALEYQRDYGDYATYPTGQGTHIASIVKSIAPDAKIVAVKIANLSENDWGGMNFTLPSTYTFEPAVEWMIDPNGDGDFSDRVADIAVIESMGSAFAVSDDSNISADPLNLWQKMMQYLSSTGMLVVTDTGGLPMGTSKYNLGYGSATPEVLGVNPIEMQEDGTYVTNDMTAHGPVRMNNDVIKPDLAAVTNASAAKVGSGSEFEAEGHSYVSAAQVAGAAAAVMANRPELSPVEIKALLMNTANSNVLESLDTAKQAEVTHIGQGVVNIEAASTSSIVVWEETSYQPVLNFGMHEVMTEKLIVKEIRVKNLTPEVQSYQLSVNAFTADKVAAEALTWHMPSEINIPANGSVLVPISVSIDANKVNNWPLAETDSFNIENWQKIEQNGYLSLTSEEQPDVNLAWLLKARPQTELSKHFTTFTEMFEGGPNADRWVNGANHIHQEFTNDSLTETHFMALPVIHDKGQEPTRDQDVNGVKLQTLAGTIMPEAQCSSGEKLVMAARFRNRIDIALANYLERGSDVLYIGGFRQQFVDDFNLREGFNGEMPTDEQAAFTIRTHINELGQPQAYFIDLEKEYDWTNPMGRYTKSVLPTVMTPNGKNLVAQFCTNELTHHDFDLTELTNSNIGIYAETDRVSLTEQGEPISVFNFHFGGEEVLVQGTDWFGNPYEEYQYQALAVGISSPEQTPLEVTEFKNEVTLQPGERARLHVTTDGYCWGACGDGFMLLSLNDDFSLHSPSSIDDEDGAILPQVTPEQSFDVVEGSVVNGDVIGRIDSETAGFFALMPDDESYNPGRFQLLNAIPGTPLSVTSAGDIVVQNADAIDYEVLPTLRLKVNTIQGNTQTNAVEILVNVKNSNDNMPVAHVTSLTPVSIENGEAIEISTAQYFSDADGDVLSYRAEGLPEEITIDASSGLISGASTQAGSFEVTVFANDGQSDASIGLSLTIAELVVPEEPAPEQPAQPEEPQPAEPTPEPTPAPESSSSGSLFAVIFGLMGVALGRRRRR